MGKNQEKCGQQKKNRQKKPVKNFMIPWVGKQ